MKKPIIIILLAMVLPFAVNAQGAGIGIKGGANFANQAITDVSTSSITDFHIGAYINLNFSEKFGITPELLYSAQGSNADNLKVDTDYIAIPIMLRWKPISLISLQAGPQFSFLSKAEHETLGDIKDQFKSNDFGLAIGAGLHLPLGLNGGIRYVYGFSNIAEASFDEEEAKNRVFQVYLGWTIFGAN